MSHSDTNSTSSYTSSSESASCKYNECAGSHATGSSSDENKKSHCSSSQSELTSDSEPELNVEKSQTQRGIQRKATEKRRHVDRAHERSGTWRKAQKLRVDTGKVTDARTTACVSRFRSFLTNRGNMGALPTGTVGDSLRSELHALQEDSQNEPGVNCHFEPISLSFAEI